MNKEQIDVILKECGITFNKKKILVDGEATSEAVVNRILQAKNTTLEEVRKVLDEASKKPIEIPDNLRYRDRMLNLEVICPAFSKKIKWNKMDEDIFGFFYLAKSSEGGGMIMLVTNNDSQYMAVSLSNSSLTNKAELTSVCSRIKYKDPDTGVVTTLGDHITKVYERVMKEANEAYIKQDAVEFGNWAARIGLPGMMLNNYKLMSTQEEITVDKEGGGTTTMYKPHTLFFPEDPIECIANHYDTLASYPKRLTTIPKLYSNDMDEPALYHIDLDSILDHDNPHPTWDKFMLRFREDERRVIGAFIWSIFDAENTGRQMLYIYDPDGFAGKSVFTKAISSGLGGNLVAAVQKDSLNNQFSMSKVWDKRLIIVDDNKNPNLVRSEKMHMILGSGLADVEEKGRKSFTYKIQCKVIASGNTQLNIDPYANHERTRVIVVEPHLTDDMLKEFVVCDKDGNIVRNRRGKPQFIGDAEFERRLIDEFRSFLVECKRDYEELCPKRSSIVLSEEMDDALEFLSDDYFDVLDEKIGSYFNVMNPDGYMSIGDFNSNLTSLMNNDDLEKIAPEGGMSRENVVQHIIKKYKVKKAGRRVNGEYVKCYIGISGVKFKPNDNSNVIDLDRKTAEVEKQEAVISKILGECQP